MARRKRKRGVGDGSGGATQPGASRAGQPKGERRVVVTGPVERPLKVARVLSGVLVLLGLLMLGLGGGVLIGRITQGWGFPMSAVPNWGRPWGAVLMLAGAAYVAAPIMLLLRPDGGSIVLMIVSGFSVLIGTPIIETTTEILYNLFQETKAHPDWVDSIWGYYMILNIAILVALYKAYPTESVGAETAPIE